MVTMSEAQANGSPHAMRVAIEGCGHGTLDAIYASIHKACEIKGWDGVDLVIICGDFQAVRDRRDLNVTAMPAKYRQMADFHQYYRGTKTAPFLTVFIGGNHEASNHLFELYYGGWAAPNIYYLGAANVMQVGPLKIAAMSGIWKGYDYNKPHYERLPYNEEDMYSIYHVRELDVRKLLSFRSQVDVGLSHDWPKGIEWLGDHKQLFRQKKFLREDAVSGKLGNTAAAKVMDRLRPPFWFSAHLHARYAAIKTYGGDREARHDNQIKPQTPTGRRTAGATSLQPPQDPVSAWRNFSDGVRDDEARQTAMIVEEQKARREEAERNGLAPTANYAIRETFKKIKLGDGFDRNVTSVSRLDDTNESSGTSRPIPQLDGCCASLPAKRRRDLESSPDSNGHQNTKYMAVSRTPDNELAAPITSATAASNPDAIDIDMSDEDDVAGPPTGNDGSQGRKSLRPDIGTDGEHYTEEHGLMAPSADMGGSHQALRSNFTSVPDQASTFSKVEPFETKSDLPYQHSHTGIDLKTSLLGNEAQVDPRANFGNANEDVASVLESQSDTVVANDISEDTLKELRARSDIFGPSISVTAPLPHPEAIENEVTRFLALSKCEDRQSFLQLLEIEPHDLTAGAVERPVKLTYVPEWLAILRVFAPELSLGGNSKAKVPTHRGDTHYRERILEEEKWIDDNVTKPGHLKVPENFVSTIPEDSISMPSDARDMPREVTNPQTSAFCGLISIENPFDIAEEERNARIAAGPAETQNSRGRGRGQRGGGGRGGNRGHRGGRGRDNRGRGGNRG